MKIEDQLSHTTHTLTDSVLSTAGESGTRTEAEETEIRTIQIRI